MKKSLNIIWPMKMFPVPDWMDQRLPGPCLFQHRCAVRWIVLNPFVWHRQLDLSTQFMINWWIVTISILFQRVLCLGLVKRELTVQCWILTNQRWHSDNSWRTKIIFNGQWFKLITKLPLVGEGGQAFPYDSNIRLPAHSGRNLRSLSYQHFKKTYAYFPRYTA